MFYVEEKINFFEEEYLAKKKRQVILPVKFVEFGDGLSGLPGAHQFEEILREIRTFSSAN